MAVVGGSLRPLLDELKGPLMKRWMKNFTTTLAALATLCVTVPSFAGETIPYKGVFRIDRAPLEQQDVPGGVVANITATLAHMGRVTGKHVTIVGTPTRSSIEGKPVLFVPLSGYGRGVVSNGDTFNYDYIGYEIIPLTATGPALPPYDVYVKGRNLGGTGRLENVTATWEYVALDYGGGTVIGDTFGEMTSIGSSKK